MAEGKKSFVVYTDWKATFDVLPNEKAGELIKHIFAYVNDENPITEDVLINAVFQNIKSSLKRDLVSYEEKKEQKSVFGKLGNLKKYHLDLYEALLNGGIPSLDAALEVAKLRKASLPDSTRSLPIAKLAVNVNDNVNDNDINIINNIYNKFVDEVKLGHHSEATKMMYAKLKIKEGSLTPLLKEFKGQLIIDQTIHKTTLQLRKHFNNWLNTQERLGKLTQYKLKT
jgi:hypothetical protein